MTNAILRQGWAVSLGALRAAVTMLTTGSAFGGNTWYLTGGVDYPTKNTSLNSPGVWKDAGGTPATAFSAEDDYYSTAWLTWNNAGAFPGKSLHFDPAQSAWNFEISSGHLTVGNDGLFLGSGKLLINHWHDADKPCSHTIGGAPITITAPIEAPAQITTTYSADWIYITGRLQGEEGTGLRLGANGVVDTRFMFADASGFAGTIFAESTIANDGATVGNRLLLAACTMPGSVDISGGSVLQTYDSDDAEVTLGGLTLRSGSRLIVSGKNAVHSQFHVTRSLTVEPGVQVNFDWTPPVTGTENRVVVFTAPADSTFTRDDFILTVNADHVRLDVDADELKKSLVAVFEPSVTQSSCYSDEWDEASTPHSSSLEAPTHWSDNQVPHSGAHYISGSYIRTPVDWDVDYVFPGLSFTQTGGRWMFFHNSATFTNLVLKGGMIEFCNGGAGTKTLACDRLEVATGFTSKIGTWSGYLIEIDSDIVGGGTLWLSGAHRWTSVPQGNYELVRANADFLGKVLLSQDAAGGNADFDSHFQTLRIGDGLALGGKLDEFCPDALKLESYGRLSITRPIVTMDGSLNRGVYVSDCGRFFVDADNEGNPRVLRCDWPITMNGTLYKEGPGMLQLGGAVRFQGDGEIVDIPTEGRNAFRVTGGSIMPRCADCCDGMAVTFEKNTWLVIPVDPSNAELMRWGLLDAKGSVSIDETLAVAFDISQYPAPSESESLDIGILTVPAAGAESIRGKLRITKPAYRYFTCKPYELADAERGTVTFMVHVEVSGMMLTVR